MIDYLESIKDMEKLCEELKNVMLQTFFKTSMGYSSVALNNQFCYTPKYRQRFDVIKKVVEICDIFEIKILEKQKEALQVRINSLGDPSYTRNRNDFEAFVDYIKDVFITAKDEINKKISLLDLAEKERFNEAIHCFLEGCHYSTVAMSVSAIEFRLLNLMNKENPDPKLEELTLGRLIREYLDNKEKYNNIIPDKHEPLLELCNKYRIFSVHPKKEKIGKRIATSVLNLTFDFLLDEKLIGKLRKE